MSLRSSWARSCTTDTRCCRHSGSSFRAFALSLKDQTREAQQHAVIDLSSDEAPDEGTGNNQRGKGKKGTNKSGGSRGVNTKRRTSARTRGHAVDYHEAEEDNGADVTPAAPMPEVEPSSDRVKEQPNYGRKDKPVLSEYELQRLERIKNNAAVMAALGIPTVEKSAAPRKRTAGKAKKRRADKEPDSDIEFVPSGSPSPEGSESEDVEITAEQQPLPAATGKRRSGSTPAMTAAKRSGGTAAASLSKATDGRASKRQKPQKGARKEDCPGETLTEEDLKLMARNAFDLFQGSADEDGSINCEDLRRLAEQVDISLNKGEEKVMINIAGGRFSAAGNVTSSGFKVDFQNFCKLFEENNFLPCMSR